MLVAIGVGFISGLVIALVAVSFTVIYNATGVVNFANGAFIVLGASLSYLLQRAIGLPFLLATAISIVVGVVLGILVDRFVISPVRRASHLIQIVGLIALNAFLDGIFRIIFGTQEKQLPTYLPTQAFVPITNWSWTDLAIIAVSAILIGGLGFFFFRTNVGSYMRASADNPLAAGLVGVNPRMISTLSWAIAGGIGALAAVMIVPKLLLTPDLGMDLTLLAFAGVVLGGLGSLTGAVIGGIALGVIQSLVGYFLGGGWDQVVNLILMLGVLAVLPNGVFGRSTQRVLGSHA